MLDEDHARRWPVIAALGVMMIFAWGSSFYLLGVLAGPIVADTGWPLTFVISGVSLGLMVSGLLSPAVGRFIGAHGGRPVLAASTLLLASGLLMLAFAPGLPIFLLAWIVLGLGMGTGLYDPAFSTLTRLYGASARRAIATLTLFGGFASTICWPLTAMLADMLGWRGACASLAALQVFICLPLALFVIPAAPALPAPPAGTPAPAMALRPKERAPFAILAAILVLGGTVMTLLSVQLLALLQARGLELSAAVALGTLLGPAQVGARLLEMAGRGRHHPLWTLTLALAMVAGGLALLELGLVGPAAAIILYGGGNGIYSIARGTLPLALFGAERYAPLMGRLARPGLVAQALAPSLGAFALARFGADATLAMLVAVALVNVMLGLSLWPLARRLDR